MSYIVKQNSFFTNFINNINNVITNYNKKNKTNKYEIINESFVNNLEKPLKNLIQFDILFKNKELHINLILFLHLFRAYALNEKTHPKDIETFFTLYKYLESQDNLINLKHNLEFGKAKLRNPTRLLYGYDQFALHRIQEYGDLLLSKSIDYLPKDINEKQLNSLIEAISCYKQYLKVFVDNGIHEWVYPFTEHYSFIPFNLKLLNEYNKLGDKIEEWLENNEEHPMEVYLQEKGFNPLYGWKYESNVNELPEQKTVNKANANDKVNTNKEVKLSPAIMQELVNNIYRHIQMYIHCDKFTLFNPHHRLMLARSVSYVIAHHSNNHMVTYGTLKVAFDQVRTYLNKNVKGVSVPKFKTRKDKKYWMVPEFISTVLDYLKIVTTSRVQLFVSEMIAHAFDVCVPSGEDFKVVVDSHRNYVIRSHNRVFNTDDKWTSKEIENALKLYQYELLPEYKAITEPETHWIFLSTLGLWLNVKDEVIVKDIYDKLKEYFEKRHTAEENESVTQRDLQYVKLMSYSNKESLLKLLNENPINLVSYAGSKEIYNDMISILEKDVYKPDMTFSDKKINITENGVVVS